MTKRPLELIITIMALAIAAPVVLPILGIVWSRDLRPPIRLATRIGKNGRPFRLATLRATTATAVPTANLPDARRSAEPDWLDRITRKLRFDTLLPLCNVIAGHMSLVGPQPSLPSEAAGFTSIEKRLLDVRPGVTDFAAIVFADECDILRNSADPELDFNRLIRPWKSRLGLFYIENRSLALDRDLLLATCVSIGSRRRGRALIERRLAELEAPPEIREIASRRVALAPCLPPGAARPVTAEDIYGNRAVTA